MRALLLASLLGGLMVAATLAAAPVALAHEATRCEPPFTFPSAALWFIPAGGASSFYLPPRTFGSLVALGVVDVTLYDYATCTVDETCHHHDTAGPMACGMWRASVLEIRNDGAANAPVVLAVGQCLHVDVCETVI